MRAGPMLAPVALLAALAALGGGCAAVGTAAGQVLGASALYQASPLAPFRTPAGDYVAAPGLPAGAAGLRELRFDDESVRAVTTVSAAQAGELRRGRLTPAQAPACSAGWVDDELWLDGQRRWERPVPVQGEHRLELRFPPAPGRLLRGALAVDVLLVEPAGRRCLRLPLPEHGEALFVRRGRASAGGSLGILINTGAARSSSSNNLLLSGSLGAWFARTRIGGRLDVCGFACHGQDGISVPLAATVEQLLHVGRRLTIGVDLGYQVGRLEDLFRLWNEQRTWVHGPRVGLLLLGPPPLASADRRQGFSARGLRIFASPLFPTVYPLLPEMAEGGMTVGREARWGWIFGLEAIAL